jgi:glutamate--cysteine ligase
MSAPATPNLVPISNKRQLIEYMEQGCKPANQWLIGTEHEKFVFHCNDLSPVAYDGDEGIGEILHQLTHLGWSPLKENDKIVALTRHGANITLEPGGQFELSGAPLANVHQTHDEIKHHLQEVKSIAKNLNLAFLGLGFNPKASRQDISFMPKGRYQIMRQYMEKKGNLGLDMMLRTCTVQVNLDFSSEQDMIKKYRTSLALQPLATAIWANSPFVEGKDTGFLSYRSHVWTDTDPDRTGILPFVFEEGMGFERVVDYLLDVPMYFIYREGRYIDLSGASFRHYIEGKLPQIPGEIPTLGDWIDHLTTAFPEVRLKRFLEMRGADCGSFPMLCALPAFWVGLLYHQDSLESAWDIVKDWTIEDHQTLRNTVPKNGLLTSFRGHPLLEIAREVLTLSQQGLKHRQQRDSNGRDERIHLEILEQILQTGLSQADIMKKRYYTQWNSKVDFAFEDYRY